MDTLKKIRAIEGLAEKRDWGIINNRVILRNTGVIIIARFGIVKYKKEFDKLKLQGKTDEQIFDMLDNYLMDVIEENLSTMGETDIMFYPTKSSLENDTRGKKSDRYIINR